MSLQPPLNDAERRAILGLWAVPGVGPKTVALVRNHTQGPLGQLLEIPPSQWAMDLPLPRPVRFELSQARPIGDLAEVLIERCQRAGVRITFPGEAAYPSRLAEISDAPPLLFYRGEASAPRRRIAMVGSRQPENNFLSFARRFAEQVARGGVCIVSGAADGVDRVCHLGALDAGEVTFAFLGSALDEMDSAQATLARHMLPRGGMIYSELPPGVRADKQTFPRRNRLISGASDAVLVLRGARGSGSLLTAKAALAQKRPLLAMPGDLRHESAAGCNDLLKKGEARLCNSAEDVWAAIGINPALAVPPARPGTQVEVESLSAELQTAYRTLRRSPECFETLLERSGLGSSAALTSALCELELLGFIIQHPGRQYERV